MGYKGTFLHSTLSSGLEGILRSTDSMAQHVTDVASGKASASEVDATLLPQMRQRVLVLSDSTQRLNRYLILNAIGFRKAAKKADKNLPSSVSPFLLPLLLRKEFMTLRLDTGMSSLTIDIPKLDKEEFVAEERKRK